MKKAVKIHKPRTDDKLPWNIQFAVWGTPAVFVAHQLKLFPLLAEKPQSLEEICLHDDSSSDWQAEMVPENDPMAVVDQYCVRAVEGLQVVEASAMPDVVRANSNLNCTMIGERLADWNTPNGLTRLL